MALVPEMPNETMAPKEAMTPFLKLTLAGDGVPNATDGNCGIRVGASGADCAASILALPTDSPKRYRPPSQSPLRASQFFFRAKPCTLVLACNAGISRWIGRRVRVPKHDMLSATGFLSLLVLGGTLR